MAPKYSKGQKVKIVPVKDRHLKYERIEPLVSKSGTIVDSYLIVHQKPSGVKWLDLPGAYYFYTVRVGNKVVKAIPEECLELCVD